MVLIAGLKAITADGFDVSTDIVLLTQTACDGERVDANQ